MILSLGMSHLTFMPKCHVQLVREWMIATSYPAARIIDDASCRTITITSILCPAAPPTPR